MLLTALLCSVLLIGATRADFDAPVYTVNLDLPPEERWVDIITEKQATVRDLIDSVFKILPKVALQELVKIGDDLVNSLPEPYAGELRGVAKAANVSLGEGMMANLIRIDSLRCRWCERLG